MKWRTTRRAVFRATPEEVWKEVERKTCLDCFHTECLALSDAALAYQHAYALNTP